MLNLQHKNAPYSKTLGVIQSDISDSEILHAAVKNLQVIDGFVKSIKILDDTPTALIAIERWVETRNFLFLKSRHSQRYEITLRLLHQPAIRRSRKLTCTIETGDNMKLSATNPSETKSYPANWMLAFQEKLTDNIHLSGAHNLRLLQPQP